MPLKAVENMAKPTICATAAILDEIGLTRLEDIIEGSKTVASLESSERADRHTIKHLFNTHTKPLLEKHAKENGLSETQTELLTLRYVFKNPNGSITYSSACLNGNEIVGPLMLPRDQEIELFEKLVKEGWKNTTELAEEITKNTEKKITASGVGGRAKLVVEEAIEAGENPGDYTMHLHNPDSQQGLKTILISPRAQDGNPKKGIRGIVNWQTKAEIKQAAKAEAAAATPTLEEKSVQKA